MPNTTLDGLQPPEPPKPAAQPAPAPVTPSAMPAEKDPAVTKWKFLLTGALGFVYLLYISWCGFLLSVLPSQENLEALVMIGVAGCLLGALAFLGIGLGMFLRIAKSKAAPRARQIALVKLALVVIPALVISAVTPFLITREPAYTIDITSPTTSEELVAPVPVTFDVARVVGVLGNSGFRPIKYRWDVNGDKKIDQETLDPQITATFEREGIYTVSVIMAGSDGTQKLASRRFVIRQAVFSVVPNPPIVDKPVVFSLSHLFPEPETTVTGVAWDFDGDGNPDAEEKGVQTSFTFLRTGPAKVTALVQLANKTQIRYERTIDVRDPPPLPFPVSIKTQPGNLIGTAPFAALFEVDTEESLYGVQWDFGDGQKSDGPRVTHTFTKNGSYAVQARVRSQSGVIATVSTVVKVVEKLNLPDLSYQGTPQVQNGNRIQGEVPLTVDLRAVTQVPFVQFSWEAPDATEVGSTQDSLQAIYRRPGRYTITLVAQDLGNRALRVPITVDVQPASSLISIQMEPETGVAPLDVRFDASESTIPGEDITGFIWNFGDNSEPEYGGAATQHLYRNPGTYVVNLTVRTASGKQQSTTRTVVVRAPVLQARILPSRLSGPAPLTVAFDGKPSTGNIGNYLWNFGDGSENDGAEVEHTFLDPGLYTVQLTITDANGKTNTSSVTITVE